MRNVGINWWVHRILWWSDFEQGLEVHRGSKKNQEVFFVLKIHELLSTLILHQKLPKLLTSASATYTEVYSKALTPEPFQGLIFVWLN